MSERLLPCPFCGGEGHPVRVGNPRQSCIVSCEDCGATLESNENGSGTSWNRRAKPEVALERAVVEAVVDSIFTNGVGEKAERLVLVDCHGKDLGGWGKTPLIDRLCAALDRARKGGE